MIEATGQGWYQLAELGLAFVLSGLIGFERELRQKSAGLRTYALVGIASALFMLVSKYGFTDILRAGSVVLDPSRIAAQIVSGIGFIGGGVIFMRRDAVRGLTTAASVWLTAAIGMSCGAGLLALAIATTASYFVIMLLLPRLLQRLRGKQGRTRHDIRIVYEDGRGLLRDVLVACTQAGLRIDRVSIGETSTDPDADPPPGRTLVTVEMQLSGRAALAGLFTRLATIDGIRSMTTNDDDEGDIVA